MSKETKQIETVDRFQVQSRVLSEGNWTAWSGSNINIGYATIERAREVIASKRDNSRVMGGFIDQYPTEYRIRHIVGTAEVVE